MSYTDSYHAYTEGVVFSGNPVRLVVALYEGALEAVKGARECLQQRDVPGRSQKIIKAHRILTELFLSLDRAKGGEISTNLSRLYRYMQVKLLDANLQQSDEPMRETERLLSELLEAWQAVADQADKGAQAIQDTERCCLDETCDPTSGSNYVFGTDERFTEPTLSTAF